VKGGCGVNTLFEVGIQKRLSFRIKVEWPVILETAKGLVEAKTRDLSAGGAHIRCKEHVHLNETVYMTMQPPDREPLKVAAKIIWSESKDESARPRIIGVKFTEISADDRRYIEQLALEDFKARLPKTKIDESDFAALDLS
jgi:Tfp pilus assembly protein PilZ